MTKLKNSNCDSFDSCDSCDSSNSSDSSEQTCRNQIVTKWQSYMAIQTQTQPAHTTYSNQQVIK